MQYFRKMISSHPNAPHPGHFSSSLQLHFVWIVLITGILFSGFSMLKPESGVKDILLQNQPPQLVGFRNPLNQNLLNEIKTLNVSSPCCNFAIFVNAEGIATRYEFNNDTDPIYDSVFAAQLPNLIFKPALIQGKPVAGVYNHIDCMSLKLLGDSRKPPVPLQPNALENELKLANYNQLPGECVEGNLWLRVLVDTKGTIIDHKVAKSDNEFITKVCVNKTKELKFEPAKLDNQLIESWYTFQINFRSEYCK